jgi:hypothetical protein
MERSVYKRSCVDRAHGCYKRLCKREKWLGRSGGGGMLMREESEKPRGRYIGGRTLW